jgi:glycosyltransferase involved in cell wall biosynthesis
VFFLNLLQISNLIIVDDGSTDNSIAEVERIEDDRILLIRQKNDGPSKARNTGMRNAKGEWIIFLDADDELAEGALTHFSELVVSHSNVDLFCCEYVVNTNGKEEKPYTYHSAIISNPYKSWLLGESCTRTGASMYKRELVEKCPFNEHIRRFEDLECLFRMFHFSKIFLSNGVVLKMNADFSAASSARKNISEDFLGHLDFKNKSFWEHMCLYQFYLWERDNYPKEVDESVWVLI